MNSECAFCDPNELNWRTIEQDNEVRVFASLPRFRLDHVLVIPNRHITQIHELTPEESVAKDTKLGKIALKLDKGWGVMQYQKYEPLSPDGTVKQSHLHFHLFSRSAEDDLFPIPEPNNPAGLWPVTENERNSVLEFTEYLRNQLEG